MKIDDIRGSYLEFFRERGHYIERSDKIVPGNDPTLLFTSAGMVQFKSLYTGEVPVPYTRAATSQKCLRAGGKANDLDEVGKTSRHLTFFEMLGNFSFGDYFKREAIEWAWKYSTEVLKLPGDRIWVSVYLDDDEAHAIWEKEIGLPGGRIVRLGAKDNFWGPAGDTGACGPCSELLFDKGEEIDPSATLENDPNERFLEFWNLVFPQFDQQMDGSRPPLKNRGIDTGMGLERLAALLQGKETVFDTDALYPIIEHTETLSKVKYALNPVPFRVIADHVRALSFMIADGVLPGNEGRGYVERRLLRRAARFGREIGLTDPFLNQVCDTVIARFSHQYPELKEKEVQIKRVILTEEQRFQSTLARGMDLLEETFCAMDKAGAKLVPGDDLFKLHDTYGFPLDLATDIATDRGYEVDREGFQKAMARQKDQARSAWAGSGEQALSPVYSQTRNEVGDTEFLGYSSLSSSAKVVALIHSGKRVDTLAEGKDGELVLDRTPFYAEAGGQVGDTGLIESSEGSAHVMGAKRYSGKMTVHAIRVVKGAISVGDDVQAQVNADAREATENHHTATHLLHTALRTILGDHVHQAGSLVSPDRLRFDFTHFEAVDADRLRDIERTVNQFIRTDTRVKTDVMSLTEARSAGAMALFGEKYEDEVRVVKVEPISMELCGGTHVNSTGEIGLFKIVHEASISAGVRRIEALCGDAAVSLVQQRDRSLTTAAQLLATTPDHVEERLKSMMEDNKRLARDLAKWKQAAATGSAVDYMSQVQDVGGVRLLAAQVDEQDPASLRTVMDSLKDKLGSGVIVLGSAYEGKAALCVSVSKDLHARVKAGDIVKHLAPVVGGGGGGRPDLAQAGGKTPERLPEAMQQAPVVVKTLLES
ncbi:MAG: alanine--tRNA ligase [Candidatus Hydrogenedentota bacterium]